jgi:hypothetical protein
MRRFVEQADRGQWTLLPECLDDFIDESNPVRVIDVFVDALDLAEMSFEGVEPAATGRPSYHPSVLLKLYIYGYLNRVQSSRRLEREAGRNVEVMWLLGHEKLKLQWATLKKCVRDPMQKAVLDKLDHDPIILDPDAKVLDSSVSWLLSLLGEQASKQIGYFLASCSLHPSCLPGSNL